MFQPLCKRMVVVTCVFDRDESPANTADELSPFRGCNLPMSRIDPTSLSQESECAGEVAIATAWVGQNAVIGVMKCTFMEALSTLDGTKLDPGWAQWITNACVNSFEPVADV